jgi:Ca2+/Na+ antiporter
MLCIKSIETEEVKLMLGVSLIIIAAAIVYMVETSLFLILLAKYGTPVLFLLLCAYIAYRNFLKKQKAAASAASERPTSKEELYTNKIQTALTPPTISIVGGVNFDIMKDDAVIGQAHYIPTNAWHSQTKSCCETVRIADN